MVATTKTVKAQNYTPEQESDMITRYNAGETVEAIATLMGKSVRSVIAKLSRAKVYKPKAYTTKTGETPMKKNEYADMLTTICGLTAEEADSLTKANKTALSKIVGKFAQISKAQETAEAETD